MKQRLEIFSSLCKWRRSYVIKNSNGCTNDGPRKEDETKEPFWKRRYIVALHGFAIYFLLNGHRINLSVAIVAMVGYGSHENQTMEQTSNISTESSRELWHNQHPTYDWSPKIQGCILGSGFVGYVLCLIIGGKLAETFGPRVMLIIGTFISSFCTTVTPFTADVGPYFLMFVQCLRGMAQSCMFPSMTVLSANWFPRNERGLLSGLALSGYILALLLVGILSSIMCDSIAIGGWPSVFYLFGGLGIFTSILQVLTLKNMPKDDPKISSAELKYILENQENKLTNKRPAVPWRKMLSSMPTYALFLGTFGKYWLGLHFISVHPTFLATILHYNMTENGTLNSLPYILSMFCNVSSSVLSSYLSAKNYLSVGKLRKGWHLLGCGLYSLCLVAMIATNCDNTVTIICTVIGIGVMGFANSGIMIVAIDMTPTFAGTLNSLNTTFASLSGFILPVLCGLLTDKEQTVQQWNKFFIITIVIVMSTAIFFCIFGSAEIQSYNFVEEDVPSKNEEEAKNDSNSVEMKDTSEVASHM